VAIIGAGSAGLSALQEVRKTTERFVIINDGPYGTTCARVACMPSKALIEVANAFQRRSVFGDMGIRGAESLRIDLPAALHRVRTLRDDFVSGILAYTDDLVERNIPGRARFLAPQLLAVGERRIAARKTIIATGSRPILPAEWRPYGNRMLTSDVLFEQENLPERLAVIGLGSTGLELAQALSRLGVEITGFESGRFIGGLSDPLVNECALHAISRDFPVHTGAQTEVAAEGDLIRVSAGRASVLVDRVLVSIGRRPNVDDLGLEQLGIELDEHGMPPFNPESMQVGDLPIFIAGDANGFRPLLHEALDEGRIAGYNAARDKVECFRRRTPLAITFSDPELVIVGERYAAVNDRDIVIGQTDFSRQSRARMAGNNRGCMRIYAARADGRLLGAEIAVPAGEHLGHLLSWAIQHRMTVFDVLKNPFYHPVIEEGLQTALKQVSKELGGKPAAELVLCHSSAAPGLS